MRKPVLSIVIAAAMLCLQAIGQAAHAADMGVYSQVAPTRVGIGAHCLRQWICRADGCGWQKFCRSGCPTPYACASLYGAYGPYGGTAYWGAYTSLGWGPRQYYH